MILDSDNMPNQTSMVPSNGSTFILPLDTDPLVKQKLDILQQLMPMLNKWYQEGLKTNPHQPLATMARDPVCTLFKKEGTIRRHAILNVFNDEHPDDNNTGIT